MKPFHAVLLATATVALGMGSSMAEESPRHQMILVGDPAQPGSDAGTSDDTQNEGSLSAPEKDAEGPDATGGMTDQAAGNVPGTSVEGDPQNENQGSLSAPEKDE